MVKSRSHQTEVKLVATQEYGGSGTILLVPALIDLFYFFSFSMILLWRALTWD